MFVVLMVLVAVAVEERAGVGKGISLEGQNMNPACSLRR